jgi:hypothetical protein
MRLVAFLMMFPLVATVSGTPEVDMEYNGSVDVYTGAPMQEDAVSSGQQITMKDGSVYDRTKHTFCYTTSAGDVYSTAINGMVTTSNVSITTGEKVKVSLYKDGNLVTNTDLNKISDPGGYVVTIPGTESEQQVLSFTIVSPKTGALTTYTLPSGFYVQTLSIDGAMQPNVYGTSVDFSGEGVYKLNYRSVDSGISYDLNVEIDHTAPTVVLSGVTDGVARGPVTISGMEKEDTVRLILDDTEVNFPSSGTVKNVGKYTVMVTDPAGNYTTENFEIRLYLNWQGVLFGVLAVGLIVAAFVYMYISRKTLRVR